MPLSYCGWEVIYDEKPPNVELKPSQEPSKRGIYTMYHGTSVESARRIIARGFRQSHTGMLGKGVYVSRDRTKAQRYPINAPDSDRVVLRLRVRVGLVKRIDRDDHPLRFTWSAHGYDTAWVPPPDCGAKSVPSGLEEDCVFNPKNIKVVDIAKAPDDAVFAELKRLLKSRGHGASSENGCQLCRRKTGQDTPRVIQPCWACGSNICPLMAKHFCRGSSRLVFPL